MSTETEINPKENINRNSRGELTGLTPELSKLHTIKTYSFVWLGECFTNSQLWIEQGGTQLTCSIKNCQEDTSAIFKIRNDSHKQKYDVVI